MARGNSYQIRNVSLPPNGNGGNKREVNADVTKAEEEKVAAPVNVVKEVVVVEKEKIPPKKKKTDLAKLAPAILIFSCVIFIVVLYALD